MAMCIIGDTHGHLQLGLCMAARMQRESGIEFEAVFLCGDVGTFTSDDQLDSTTRRHGKANPCELEFLHQWSIDPAPPWLAKIFQPVEDDGLGLLCPVVMVHGNHEGFSHLKSLIPVDAPDEPSSLRDLPAVDSSGHIHYLPSGWTCRTDSGKVVAGVGGIERGQRCADYHELAYIEGDAIMRLLEGGPVDILITHQGPSQLQGMKGSDNLNILLEEGIANFWFHGHSIPNPDIKKTGKNNATTVVPLADIAFPSKGPEADNPGDDGWAILEGDTVERLRPDFWREYRKKKWKSVGENALVSPDLARWT